MRSHPSIQLAKRTFATPDPIDTVFQQIPIINKNRIAEGLDPIISLCVGEPHLPINETTLEDLRQFLQQPQTKSNFGYSQLQGRAETLNAIAQLYNYYYPQANYQSNEVMINNGATQALWNAFGIFIEQGDVVLAFEPCYPTYKQHTEFFGGKLVSIPTSHQHFRPNAKTLEAYLLAHPQTKVLVLNYPNNPTGIDLTKKELEDICVVLKKHPQVAIIDDDVYRELSSQPHLTILDIDPSLKDRSVMINSASKGLIGAPDMRIGMTGANAAWIERLTAMQSNVVGSTSFLTQQAAIIGIQHVINQSPEYIEWLQHSKSEYAKNIKFTCDKLKSLGINVIHGGHGFFLLADLSLLIGLNIPESLQQKIHSSTFKSDNDIVSYLLHSAGVATIPASGFGIHAGKGYLRISCAKNIKDLAQALTNIESALKALPELKFNKASYNPSKTGIFATESVTNNTGEVSSDSYKLLR